MIIILILTIFSTYLYSQTIIEKISPGVSIDVLMKNTNSFSEMEYGGSVDLSATSNLYLHAELYGGRMLPRYTEHAISSSNISRTSGTLSYLVVQSDSASLIYFSAKYGNEKHIGTSEFIDKRTHYIASSLSYINGFSPALFGIVFSYRRNLTNELVLNIIGLSPSIRIVLSPKVSLSQAIGVEIYDVSDEFLKNIIHGVYGYETRIDYSISDRLIFTTHIYFSNILFNQFGVSAKYAL